MRAQTVTKIPWMADITDFCNINFPDGYINKGTGITLQYEAGHAIMYTPLKTHWTLGRLNATIKAKLFISRKS